MYPQGIGGAVRLTHLLPETELQCPSLTGGETEAQAKDRAPRRTVFEKSHDLCALQSLG